MLRIAIVVAACASSAATLEGSANQKASILRQKATAVTKTRKLAACTGTLDWSCVDTTTCRKFDVNAVGYECLPPNGDSGYCEDSVHCTSNVRCFENACVEKSPLGGACTKESTTMGLSFRYPSAQCTSGYCKYIDFSQDAAATCQVYTAIGAPCKENAECDIGKAHCDTVNGQKACSKYVATGGSCTSDEQCGGNDPPNTYGFCDANEAICKDFGEEVAGFFAALGTTLIVIVVAIVACCALTIYCACCRKRQSVVVVQS